MRYLIILLLLISCKKDRTIYIEPTTISFFTISQTETYYEVFLNNNVKRRYVINPTQEMPNCIDPHSSIIRFINLKPGVYNWEVLSYSQSISSGVTIVAIGQCALVALP